ncbi:MAG: hypothetical protein QM728_14270 [Gordonia sp. (in: high G+C Gram-positive bacteria)]|uniref:hypothetical protein n=1 Tax=Gordonia sp. (in: high G+C Gram-positive bacteria) TaxID=84139 RepID=UPI0039E69A1C
MTMDDLSELDEGVARVVQGTERSIMWICVLAMPFLALLGGTFLVVALLSGGSDPDRFGVMLFGAAMVVLAVGSLPALRPRWLPRPLRAAWYRRSGDHVEFGSHRWASIPLAVMLLLLGAAPLVLLGMNPGTDFFSGRGGWVPWLSPFFLVVGLGFLVTFGARTQIVEDSVVHGGRVFGGRNEFAVSAIRTVQLDAPNNNIRLRFDGDVREVARPWFDWGS